MHLKDDLKGSRVTLTRAAELAGMHPAHFRRLIRQGIFPKPRKTAKGRPYFDYDLLARVAGILSTGVGQNGQEVLFYRRKGSKPAVRHVPKPQPPDNHLASLRAVSCWFVFEINKVVKQGGLRWQYMPGLIFIQTTAWW
jgi:hypothetical protein